VHKVQNSSNPFGGSGELGNEGNGRTGRRGKRYNEGTNKNGSKKRNKVGKFTRQAVIAEIALRQ